MRYYDLRLYANAETIEENAKIKLKDYDYDNPIAAMNKYLYKNLGNDVYFVVYRDEGDSSSAVFSYDETSTSFDEAFNGVLEELRTTFCIKKLASNPHEITTGDFARCLREAKRRSFHNFYRNHAVFRYMEWYDAEDIENISKHYSFKERIISDKAPEIQTIYDKSFIAEIDNITKHANNKNFTGNIVHYAISANSTEASIELAEVLMQGLYQSGRIASKRLEVISDIGIDLYKDSYIENILENNTSGAILIDLSTKIQYDKSDYTMTSKYLESLFKRYRNNRLFIFTYNIDDPGFAFQILPNLKKYVIPVALKEGRTNRKNAIQYLKFLIGKSEYAEYADQAKEYMERFPGNSFSQTDVLEMFEQFGPWSINKNVIKGYDYDMTDDFMMDRNYSDESYYDRLQNLIGLKTVKSHINRIIDASIVEKERKKKRGFSYNSPSMHMVFAGNPGSAKTTVANLFSGIMKEKGILKSGSFVMVGGQDLNGYVQGVRDAFISAKGGVLFIDEAYEIFCSHTIATLIQEMETWKDEVIVILAGYNNRMESFIKRNEGLKSRIPHWIDFPDYTTEELVDIFKLMLKEKDITATQGAINKAEYILNKARYITDFGNGRYVRNMIGQSLQAQSTRLLNKYKNIDAIKNKELFCLTEEDIMMVNDVFVDENKEGQAIKDLNELIGLTSVKDTIRQILAQFKINKLYLEKGIRKEKPSLHMVFTGNPGTAKTTVARLVAKILNDEKVLPTAKYLELGRADVVGIVVGETAQLIKRRFEEARGGVLFIDEAYSLCDGYKGYGDEAINTIVQEMENHREDTIVIFAGYPEKMKEFIDRNEGLASRISFHVNFPDYSEEELMGILDLMLKKHNCKMTKKAKEKSSEIFSRVIRIPNYGNGRFVRTFLEQSEMKAAERILSTAKEIDDSPMVIEAEDISDDNLVSKLEDSTSNTIGFAA